MESVTIKNAENKLEACSGKRKIHDRSKAVVANVSLGAMGGRRRLALLDKFHVGQRVQLADRKHPTSRYPQGQRVKGDYGILSKKLAKKHKYLPQKWIPAGAKGTVKKVASATRGYSTAEDSALAVWVVFDDIKTFTPGKKITTMAPVRIENAPNKLEACTTTAPAYALPSKAAVKNVSLGRRRLHFDNSEHCGCCLQSARRRLGSREDGIEVFVRERIETHFDSKADEHDNRKELLKTCQQINGYYHGQKSRFPISEAEIKKIFNQVWSQDYCALNRESINFKREVKRKRKDIMSSVIASGPAAAGSPEDSQSESDSSWSKFEAEAKAEAKAKAAKKKKKKADKKRSDAALNAWAKANRKKASAVGNTLLQKRTGNRAMDKAFAVDDNLDW